MNRFYLWFCVAVGVFLISSLNLQGQHQPFPKTPPHNVTNTQDRDQMLWQLGIVFPNIPAKQNDDIRPEGVYPSNENKPEDNWTDATGNIITRSNFGLWNNYDDISKGFTPGAAPWRLGDYTPIELLEMKDGTPVTDAQQWWEERRSEIMRDVKEEVWGVIPPEDVLPAVTWSVVTTKSGTGADAFIQKEITGAIATSRFPEVRNIPKIAATLRVPANAKSPVPVMIVMEGDIDTYWKYMNPHGWATCTFKANELQPDNGAGLTSYLIGLVNQGNWRSPSDWGTLGAWSWGVSKLIDYFETDDMVDATKIGLAGHSRYGKATLLSMAYEPRIAIAFPSCAGSLGTKMNRRHYGQDLENSGWEQEYHWVSGNFFQWMGALKEDEYLPRKIENMPVDAHSLLSLCAPRPVFMNTGTEDTWTDPYGIYLTGVATTPVYELLGEKGLIMEDKKPEVDVSYIDGNIGYRYHEGGHTDAPDWPAFFEFASKHLK